MPPPLLALLTIHSHLTTRIVAFRRYPISLPTSLVTNINHIARPRARPSISLQIDGPLTSLAFNITFPPTSPTHPPTPLTHRHSLTSPTHPRHARTSSTHIVTLPRHAAVPLTHVPPSRHLLTSRIHATCLHRHIPTHINHPQAQMTLLSSRGFTHRSTRRLQASDSCRHSPLSPQRARSTSHRTAAVGRNWKAPKS
jgi:hypothetical protein